MKLYLALPKKLYDHKIMPKAVAEIEKYFKENNIPIESFFNPATDFDKLGIKIPDSIKGEFEIEQFIQNSCIEMALKNCDGIVYMNTFTKTGNISFTPGVKAEVNNKLKEQQKQGDDKIRIFRIQLTNTGDIDTAQILGIGELSIKNIDESIERLYQKYTPEKQGWTLKSIDDYLKLYKVQPEMLEHLYNQCYDEELTKIGVHGILKHKSFIYETKSGIPKLLCHDPTHYGYNNRHAYPNPVSQTFETACPYFLNTKLFHNRIFELIPKFPLLTETDEIVNIIVQNRVIHKFMYMFDPVVHKIGVCLRNKETGRPIVNKEGKYVPDPKLIKGVQILIDLDIKKSAKIADLDFFSPVIYTEYVKALDLLLARLLDKNYNTKDVKIMFSGNGLYIILRKYIDFSESGVKNYYVHELAWELIRDSYQKTLWDNKIKYLQIEKGYGWNRYFKLAGTLHASKERVSIPLNVDKMLNDPNYFNYILENSSIQNLSDNKVRYLDILNASGW
jgi:hypothetical protein